MLRFLFVFGGVLVYGKCECFVMQMLYVCVLCALCGSSYMMFHRTRIKSEKRTITICGNSLTDLKTQNS